MQKRIDRQLSLFGSTIPPASKPEADAVYSAVLCLRNAGSKVYRAGYQKHLVDGRVVSTPTLRRMVA